MKKRQTQSKMVPWIHFCSILPFQKTCYQTLQATSLVFSLSGCFEKVQKIFSSVYRSAPRQNTSGCCWTKFVFKLVLQGTTNSKQCVAEVDKFFANFGAAKILCVPIFLLLVVS